MKDESWKEKSLSSPYVFNFISYLFSQSYLENLKIKKYFIGYCLSQKEFEKEFCTSVTPQAKDKKNYNLKPQEFLEEDDRKAPKFSFVFNPQQQEVICEEWKNGNSWCNATKYKSVLKKIRPVNVPMPQDINPPLQRPPLSRDPYLTPLTPYPPEFSPTLKITEERLKVINFGPDGWLSSEELKLFKHIITLRQDAVAFCEEERGVLKHSDGLPYIIPVIQHEPWQKKPIPIPESIKQEYIELVRERIKTGLYEQSTSSYSSPVFCVMKHNGKLRIVHDLQPMNKVTIKDAGIPPSPEDFVEAFSGRTCYGLGDIMGGYDERELAYESRPLTTFETPLGRLQLTRIPQGATNSVAVYQAQMMWILQDEIPHYVGIFIDDGAIKGPESDYNGEVLPENPGNRRFIWEYAITLERILLRIGC